MRPPLILKLGGSILTEKRSGQPLFRMAAATSIAKEISSFRNEFPRARMIILHGGGSFAHPLAHRYAINGALMTPTRMMQFEKITHAVRNLSDRLTATLHRAHIPTVPIQTNTIITLHGNRLSSSALPFIRGLLDGGGVPLLGGDIVIDSRGFCRIISADRLAVFFSKAFRARRILFATDVPGVYAHYPPHPREKPLRSLDRVSLNRISSRTVVASHPRDVTGAMSGKLKALEALRRTVVSIFDGQHRASLRRALRNQPVGTAIRF